MIKRIAKAADKLFLPIFLLNLAAIGSVFYNRGKLDAIEEISAAKENADQTEEV